MVNHPIEACDEHAADQCGETPEERAEVRQYSSTVLGSAGRSPDCDCEDEIEENEGHSLEQVQDGRTDGTPREPFRDVIQFARFLNSSSVRLIWRMTQDLFAKLFVEDQRGRGCVGNS